ncbi:MAG: DNA polymerase III subunit gamma/tau [Microgenomates group bacterium]|nr:DNA polymerase III subunit gamma/tau [Microgenomates group bacterium]
MFYLKYRPHTIKEIDNLKVAEIIKKILQSKKIPHAFLFVGQKGTGKTSTARIFAKAVNCLKIKDNYEPCNQCKNCLAIDASSATDVVEMDAASNRGIEEIKNLIKESAFIPMTCRYRIFIVDEAHMITHDAFNALLKTLEEPPPSVIFILATTNQEKIPKTIASRCFIINFGKAKKSDILRMLKRIAAQEKLTVKNDLLELIASHSEGSFRDAAKILEELVIQNKLSFEEGKNFLGVVGRGNFLEIIKKEDLSSALSWINEFSQKGGSFKNLIEELLEDLRLILLAKNKVVNLDESLVDFSQKEVVVLMKLLNEAYANLKITPIESIPLEIAITEFYNFKNHQQKD